MKCKIKIVVGQELLEIHHAKKDDRKKINSRFPQKEATQKGSQSESQLS